MEKCIFCKIASGELGAPFLYEDESVVAFDDLRPRAPQHKLIIPKLHIETINDLTAENAGLVGHMVLTAKTLAEELAIADEGYRLVMNCNKNGGQEVYHIHLHLLGGRRLIWPPG